MAPKHIFLQVVAFASVSRFGVQAAAVCGDATEESNPACYKNTLWAKTTGIKQDKGWYAAFPFLNENSSFAEFQYAVNLLRGPEDNCTMPCSLSAEQVTKFSDAVIAAKGKAASSEVVEAAKDAKETATDAATDAAEAAKGAAKAATAAATQPQSYAAAATVTDKPSPGGWGIWTYLLIGLGICCLLPCLGLACSAFICYESVAWIFEGGSKPEKKKKKKSRAIAAPTEVPAAATPMVPAQTQPAVMMQPTTSSFIAMAQPTQAVHVMPMTYTASPVTYTAPVATASPVYAASGASYTAAPAPVVSYTAAPAPVVSYAAAPAAPLIR